MKQISQSQIRDYQECRYRYYLTYIQKLTWPAPVTPTYAAMEKAMLDGQTFHQFVNRFVEGIDAQDENNENESEKIRRWITNFRQFNPLPGTAQIFSEIELAVPSNDILWIGKYDIIAVQEKQLTIFDWKTAAKVSNPRSYSESPQTLLYRYILYRSSPRFFEDGKTIDPKNLQMIYWFPAQPDKPIRINYSEEQFQADQVYFDKIGKELSENDAAHYPQTEEINRCRHCHYMTYCGRIHEDEEEENQEQDEWEQSDLFDAPPEDLDDDLPEKTF